jgi:hypothetical protein
VVSVLKLIEVLKDHSNSFGGLASLMSTRPPAKSPGRSGL